MRWLSDPRLSVLFRLLVGVAFVWAGIVKIADAGAFEEGLINYRMLPPSLIPVVAVTLPPIEVAAGICLVLGVFCRGAALLATSMLAVFTAAIVQAILRGINVECGCFGAGSDAAASMGWQEVVRDLALLAAGAHVLFWDRGILSLERLRTRLRDARQS